MTTAPAAILTLMVLSAVGLFPAVAAVGLRWVTVPLLPLGGAVVAALAAAGFVAVGGTFMIWFAGLAVAGAVSVAGHWSARPEARPWRGRGRPVGARYRATGVIGALAVAATGGWCLRSLSAPAVGFDARAIWLMRGGWFLQPHHQLLFDMRAPSLVLYQSAYPPLVSASTAVAWSIAGNHSFRLGVVVVALLNACALAAAAFALVECGRTAAVRLAYPREQRIDPGPADGEPGDVLPLAPLVAGVVAAVLLVPVASGITGPFMTNGYADPIWSLAAVGAVAFGLQLQAGRFQRGATALLLVVAGMSKEEGTAIAIALIALVAVRAVATMAPGDRRRNLWRPVALAGLEVGAVALWPVVMRVIRARGATSTFAPAGVWSGRVRPTYDALVPYLHVVVLAVPLAIVGAVFLSRVRRAAGTANDGWGWAGLSVGLAGVGAVLVTDSGAIGPLLAGSVHRLSEFPALVGWWIVAVWAVVASGSVAAGRRRRNRRSRTAPAVTEGVTATGVRHDLTTTA